MSDLTPSLVVHQNHRDLSTCKDQESYGITTSPQDVLKPHGSSSGHPFTWISQPGYEKYSFYTEVPNQHLKVITKKQKYVPVEVEFLTLNSPRFFVTTRNLIELANSLVYPERIHRGIEWTSVFETLVLCLSVCLWANFLIFLFQPSLFIQYSTEECSTVQYKAAGPVRAVISIRYGSKEGVQGSLLVP